MNAAIIVFLLSAALTAGFIAQSKRQSFALWFVLGAVFPFLAILGIMIAPARKEVPPR